MTDRIEEFVWYHNNGDAGSNPVVLKAYADKLNLNAQDRLDICFFYSITYSVPSAAIMLNSRGEIKTNPKLWAGANLKSLIFQSDRKYVRMNGLFSKCLIFWRNNLCGNFDKINSKLTAGNHLSEKYAIPFIESWVSFGRYSAYLFAETYETLMGLKPIHESKVEFNEGRTFSAGILNVFGMDDLANKTDDKHAKLPVPIEVYNSLLDEILDAIRNAGGNDSSYQVETSLCGYRKHFKGTRYNGYYADRQLGEIKALEKVFPGMAELFSGLYYSRRQSINPVYLGELNGWKGIRTELKKDYINSHKVIGYAD